jgi:ABC-type uncharacterized transport system fused permease/ATPase subunit
MHHNYSQTQRKIEYKPNGDAIKIENYKLYLKGSEILKCDNLEIPLHTKYVIKGQNGSGKTTFLTDLKMGGIKPITSEGKITLPIESKKQLMFIDQDTIQPKGVSLFELCLYPSHKSTYSKEELLQKRELVIKLMDLLEIDTLNSEDEGNLLKNKLDATQYRLSGGQKQKINIIQAILANPEILVLDESFSNLNQYSILLVQKVISEYLPDTTILSVDHRDAIDRSFYDKKIEIVGGEMFISEI